jgi:transposase
MRLIGMSITDAAAELPPQASTAHLPDDPATLKRMILELLDALHDSQRDYEALQQRLDLLLKRLYGPRGERFDPNQLLLFTDLNTGQDPATATEPAADAKPKRRCQPHGRRKMPRDLPHEPRHHVLTEAERLCPGCGQVRIDIGVDRSDQLEYRPATLFVIEHFVHKYVCPCCSKQAPAARPQPDQGPQAATAPASPAAATAATPGPTDTRPAAATPACQIVDPGTLVVAAVKPAMPIAKGLPGPGLLAHVIVSKFVDHLPLHRLERIYERQGLFLARSTLCDWLAACAQLLRPLYELLVAEVLQSRALHTDDTPVKMQELVSHLLSTARMWVYLGDLAHPYNVFDFTLNRKRDGPQQFLANYRGYLHADAFSGYDCLYLPEAGATAARILEVACNAHARRKFYDARSSDALRSAQALAYYGQLYEIERQAKGCDDTQRWQMRQDLSLPILAKFRQWLQGQELWPKHPLQEAIGYALNQWQALCRYTEAGFLAIDNNVAEREMKRIAIGRKNWLFVGSPQGGQTAAVLCSFTSTCHRLQVEPWAYLQDVLTRLPATPAERLGDLLPDRWQAARQAEPTTATATAASNPSDESAS